VEQVDFSENENIGVITLNDAGAGVTLDAKTLAGLRRALLAAQRATRIRTVVLRSSGKNFCLGMDLDAAAAGDGAAAAVAAYAEVLTTIFTLPLPVVCIVTGAVKGGGVGLVSACDIIVGSPAATFQLSEAFWGLVPYNVIPLLCSVRLSPQKVKYLVLSAKELNAEQAKSIGLVDDLFTEATIEKEVRSLLKNLLRVNPAACAEAKRFINSLFATGIDGMLAEAQSGLVNLMKSSEVKSALLGLKEGMTPPWFSQYARREAIVPETTR
jgi:enoyl-CoA hydratase/carnithine racemase